MTIQKIKEASKMGTIIATCKWNTPISHYKESSSGNFHIVKKEVRAGISFETGEASGIDEVLFTAPVKFTILKEGDEIWMSDSPMEYYQTNDLVTRTESGRILIGGLGLGLITHLLARRTDITEIVVIDKEPDVIKLVSPYLSSKVKIIEGDFLTKLQELESQSEYFDTVIADIWKTGFEDADRELFEDCRMVMGDCFPDATHLFWAFQKENDEELAKYAIHHLENKGIELEVHETSGEVVRPNF
jgi:hypothetical protein